MKGRTGRGRTCWGTLSSCPGPWSLGNGVQSSCLWEQTWIARNVLGLPHCNRASDTRSLRENGH
eukprot:10305957-Lingulodinium_polyedra.AAC.1